jgi:hypothetical protein
MARAAKHIRVGGHGAGLLDRPPSMSPFLVVPALIRVGGGKLTGVNNRTMAPAARGV